jgi:hypothetical protein
VITACLIAHQTVGAQSFLNIHWVSGDENMYSDALSCDFHFSNLTFVLEQVLFGLRVSPLSKQPSADLSALCQPSKDQSKIKFMLDKNVILLNTGTSNSWILDRFSCSQKHKILTAFAQA